MYQSIQLSHPWWRRLQEMSVEFASPIVWFRDLQRRAREHSELSTLDAAALRDLGLDRSELASYGFESRGGVVHTRRRVAP